MRPLLSLRFPHPRSQYMYECEHIRGWWDGAKIYAIRCHGEHAASMSDKISLVKHTRIYHTHLFTQLTPSTTRRREKSHAVCDALGGCGARQPRECTQSIIILCVAPRRQQHAFARRDRESAASCKSICTHNMQRACAHRAQKADSIRQTEARRRLNAHKSPN